jgi:NAD(P)-dependent dehydrogenase (short-subunit alcohol dehydrogenase family)
VNVVMPGFIATGIFGAGFGLDRAGAETMAATLSERGAKLQPAGRVGRADDVAEAMLYLCSDAGSFVTGTQLVVDGGMTIGPRSSCDPEVPNAVREALGITPEMLQAMADTAKARAGG